MSHKHRYVIVERTEPSYYNNGHYIFHCRDCPWSDLALVSWFWRTPGFRPRPYKHGVDERMINVVERITGRPWNDRALNGPNSRF